MRVGLAAEMKERTGAGHEGEIERLELMLNNIKVTIADHSEEILWCWNTHLAGQY
jgi:hypothetical protein